MYHRGGTNAAAAGECYELAGPQGKTTVIVADIANDSLPNTCDVGRAYFDIGFAAFTNLFTPEVGYGPVTFRLVPAPVVGNIKMVCVVNSGGFYLELRPYNHRAGVSKLEVQATANSPWLELPRTAYNSFVYSSGSPLAVPFNARITSRFGEVITFPAIASLTSGDRLTANGQFTVFPDQGPSPVWIVPAVYAEGFTNSMGTPWTPSSSSLNPTYTGSAYQGNYSLRITNMIPYGTVSFFAPLKFPPKPDGFVEFAIRSETATITTLIARIQGYDAAGVEAAASIVKLPSIDGSWRVLRIPLAPTGPPAQIYSLLFQNISGSTTIAFDLDSISFR
jgi:expansin (peptidoglycan-binding protein)